MAKGNMLLGFARGKVGSLVFKRQNGAQVTAPRVTPRNPQTLNQMAQRIAFSSAVKTAKELDGIVNHSFQGVAYGQKSIQHFTSKAAKVIKANIMAALDSNLSTSPFRNTAAIPLSAISVGSAAVIPVSSGDLASPVYYIDATGSSPLLKFGDNITIGTSITVDNYQSFFGVPVTDQLTFIFGSRRDLSEVEGDTVFFGANFKYSRLNWKKDLAAGTELFSYDSSGDNYNINVSAIDTERSSPEIVNFTGDISLSGSTGGLLLTPDFVDGGDVSDYIVCAAVIASRYEDGSWRRSTEQLLVIQTETEFNTQAAASLGWAWNPVDELIASAMKADNVSEDWYLNKKKVTE